ncbi:hypothetical protein HDU83_000251, partial [Entophlyctis luteolus]
MPCRVVCGTDSPLPPPGHIHLDDDDLPAAAHPLEAEIEIDGDTDDDIRPDSALDVFERVAPAQVPAPAPPPHQPPVPPLPVHNNLPNFERDLSGFARVPLPFTQELRCKIVRVKNARSSSNDPDAPTSSGSVASRLLKSQPAYELFIEAGDRLIFFLSARKLQFSRGNPAATAGSLYAISTAKLADWSKESIIANVKSNFIGTAFSVFDTSATDSANSTAKFGSYEELAAVLYEPNILGVKGPRKMTVILPGMEPMPGRPYHRRKQIRPQNEKETLLHRSRRGHDKDIHVMHNKTPQWNPETESFVLNFNTRVTMASVKNFQVVHDHDLDYIIMQFGRIAADKFTMDYKYPMSAVQAFGIVLT